MSELAKKEKDFPPVLFFYQGTPEEGKEFFERFWPEASAVSDPERFFYKAFGLTKGTLGQLFGPSVIACGLRSAKKGYMMGVPVGDPLQMPGLFLVKGRKILKAHEFAHAGDHPEFREFARPEASPG